jgi:hypothetical protein
MTLNQGYASMNSINDKMIHVSQCKNEMCPLKEFLNQGISNNKMHSTEVE